ncbi:GNAT family N-acetyltransferase [Pseudomonas sp.]|uniref:GNAT family N-acetyltransferase n=1 Tax=Pseudomonas sp. TaxID=306 RepID=UPI00299CF93B|nr:GNAT family N-acetyltransferase [Pseudomonas sp.]MDX1366425.1 GNAT family N-acetyltransferase [Pseudomonas sp.]
MTNQPTISIRDYRPSDLRAVVTLFSTSVHGLASAHYDATQRLAWAPEEADLQAWQVRLAALQVRLAEHREQLTGFIGFTANGHVELLFSSPLYARQGVATALYRDAEACLRSLGVASAFTEASLTARPFFTRQGFSVEQAQTVARGAVTLQRFAMRKPLRP